MKLHNVTEYHLNSDFQVSEIIMYDSAEKKREQVGAGEYQSI